LVVDASDTAVKSGQTHPADLLELHAKGVRVFNYPYLHGKVYVFGRVAVIGSANASHHSSQTLLEAVVLTTDRRIAEDAKAFVEKIAKNELGPEELERLQKIYRPPRVPLPRRQSGARKWDRETSLPNIRIVHLIPQDFSDRDWTEQEAGEEIAERRREHGRSWKTDYFRWTGAHSFRRRDKIMMVTRERSGRRLVDPPGTVYVRSYQTGNGQAAFVYLEFRNRRRRDLRSVANSLGRGAMKRLRRGGRLNHDLSAKVYNFWDKDRPSR
jgi:hypothetical protein